MQTQQTPLTEAGRRTGIASTATDFARYLEVHKIPTENQTVDLALLHGEPVTIDLAMTFTEITN